MLRDSAPEKSHIESPVPRKKLKSLKPQVFLEGKELWNCFYRLGTEMIITKTGRSVSSHFAFLLIARSWDKEIYLPQSPELRWFNRFRSLVVFITVRVFFFFVIPSLILACFHFCFGCHVIIAFGLFSPVWSAIDILDNTKWFELPGSEMASNCGLSFCSVFLNKDLLLWLFFFFFLSLKRTAVLQRSITFYRSFQNPINTLITRVYFRNKNWRIQNNMKLRKDIVDASWLIYNLV